MEAAIVEDLHVWLGAEPSSKKTQSGQTVTILGIEYDFISSLLGVTPERRQNLLDVIEAVLQENALSPSLVAKLKGRLEHLATHYWGRFGRNFLRALSERQYGGGSELGDALKMSLRFWRWLRQGGEPGA